MNAELITRFKNVASNGDLIEMVIWRLPRPVPPCTHRFKYRLAYIVGGSRIIGFDNERGKGDHFHMGDREYPYVFRDLERLIEDFLVEVEQWRTER